MQINKICIKNYRNFRDFEIDLKPFTLIIGENNIGKTNLLNAIGLVLSQEITFFKKRSLELEDINYTAIREFKEDVLDRKPLKDIRKTEVSVELTMKGFDTDQEAVVADWFINADLDTAKLTYVFFLHDDLSSWLVEKHTLLGTQTKHSEETPEAFRERLISLIDFPLNKYSYRVFGGIDSSKMADFFYLKMLKYEYLDALRDSKTQLVASGEYRLLYRILSNRGEGKYDEIKEVLIELDSVLKRNTELNAVKTEIRGYLDKTSLVEDQADNSVDFEFTKIEETEILKKLSLVYGGAPVTVTRNGLGRNNLLYISLVLSHLIGRSADLVKFRIIAIEEPEAHLHPHLQEHLAKNIEGEVNPSLQLIVTSHSTHITSQIGLENTVILFNDSGQVKNHYILRNFENSAGTISAEDQYSINYLKKYLDATKSTMFFAKRILLVEGISEQLLIPKIFQLYTGKTLEKMGITMVNVNGVAFKHFLKIIKNGFFVKALVLTDSDSDTQKFMRAQDLKSEYEGINADLFRVEISDTATFEIDILDHNLEEKIIKEALIRTRPNKGKQYFDSITSPNTPVVAELFNMIVERDASGKKIKDYKADFAFNLIQEFDDLEAKGQHVDFEIPGYIQRGFNFICL